MQENYDKLGSSAFTKQSRKNNILKFKFDLTIFDLIAVSFTKNLKMNRKTPIDIESKL